MLKRLLTVLMICSILVFIGCTEKPKGKAVGETVSTKEYNFENGTADWKPIEKMKISEDKAKKHEEKASMKITGIGQAGQWSFTRSEKISIYPGKRYRLTGWMLIDSMSDEGTSSFKCEFWQPDKWVQNVETNKYDINKKGQWQELTAEFTSPDVNGLLLSLAIEKRPMEKNLVATLYVNNIKLEMIK